jgi:SAM-dependent methyltransferase
MGAFFADGGFDAYLLDTSDVALHIARANFEADDLAGHPVCGDALALPYPSGVFDVVVSIGLLEHFADITQLLQDQLRVLRPGGVFLGYVVPERTFSVQTLAVPINLVLRMAYAIYKVFKPVSKKGSRSAKAALYRNRFVAADYLAVLRQTGIQEAGSFGMFPVPLVSQSPAFPFSPMTPALERILVRIWQRLLSLRRRSSDPWICREGWGLAFLVWARK